MSREPPDRPPAAGLLDALPVRRNAAVGVLVGVAIAAVAFLVRVLEVWGPAPDQGSPAFYLALAFVLAATTAALVATVLTGVSAYRVLSRAPERPD